MLGMGAAADDANLHIRDLGAREHSPVAALLQMGHDQALPVEGQIVDGTAALKDQSAAGFTGLQQQVDLCVVAQGLEMADALHGVSNGLLVDDPGGSELDLHVEAVLDQALQDLPLDLTHDLDSDLLFLLIVGQAEHGILFLQGAQLSVGRVEVLSGRQDQPALHDRLQQTLGLLPVRLGPQSHTGPGPCQPRDGDNDAGGSLLQGLILFPFVKAELGRLLGLPFFIRALRNLLPGQKGAAGDLHPGKPRAGPRSAACGSIAALVGDLVDPGAESLPAGRLLGQCIHHSQQVVDPFLPKGRAKADRKELPLRGQLRRIRQRDLLPVKKALHQVLVADRDLLLQLRRKDRFGLQGRIFCRIFT